MLKIDFTKYFKVKSISNMNKTFSFHCERIEV